MASSLQKAWMLRLVGGVMTSKQALIILTLVLFGMTTQTPNSQQVAQIVFLMVLNLEMQTIQTVQIPQSTVLGAVEL
tara:strand:+ start:165 stop:395 length:231 start_codon:yes stop_codon:yes gene_type:complete